MLAGGEGDALTCIVGRELCLFTSIDAGKVPDKQRASFVALAVKRASPFPDAEHGLAWTGGQHAAVWYWSRARVAGLLDAGLVRKRIDFVPEAIFVGEPVEDGAQLLALAHGVEGRVWKQGRLLASRWWTSVPDLTTWAGFLRSAGLPADAAIRVPDTIDAAIAADSWAASSKPRRMPTASSFEDYLPRAIFALGIAALAVFGFQMGSIVRNHVDAWRATSDARNLDAPLQRILDAREKADRNRAAIEEFLLLREGRPQHQLLAEAVRLLPERGWELRRWSQPAPERIEATLMMPEANPEQLVSSWEASPLFDEVTTELQPRNNTVTLQAKVVPATRSSTP